MDKLDENIFQILHNWNVYSNYLYIIPIIISIYYGNTTLTVLLSWLAVMSYIHHKDQTNKTFSFIDVTDCVILSIAIMYYLYIIGTQNMILYENNKPLVFLIFILSFLAIGTFALAKSKQGVDPITDLTGQLNEINIQQQNKNIYTLGNFDYEFYHIIWHVLTAIVISLIFIYLNIPLI